MISYSNVYYRVLLATGTLFFFIDCAGKIKSEAWEFDDAHDLAVRILDSEQWLAKSKRNFNDIDKIINQKLKRYKNTDSKIYEELKTNHLVIKNAISKADSITKIIGSLHAQLRDISIDSLDSKLNDTLPSFRASFESHSQELDIIRQIYSKSVKKIKNAFRRDRKKLIFIENEYAHYQNTLLELRFNRGELAPKIEKFNSSLHKALMENNKSPKVRKIRTTLKSIEQYELRMDKYEKFLSNIEKIALKEVKGYVVLLSKNSKPFKFKNRYKSGRREYFSVLKKMEKILKAQS